MAVQSYEVVGALREMLQSQERREQSKVQTALASMQMAQRSREFGLQFAQQKKMQDVQLAGQQLQFLQNVNTQMMGSEATRFLTSSGLGALYNESDDGVESAIKILTKKPKIKDGINEGGYGFSDSDANRIAAAIWMSYKGSPSAILQIADELNSSFKEKSPSAAQKNLMLGFYNAGYFTKDEYTSGVQESGELESISKVVKNTRDIAAEMYEYGRGEYEIQRDIGMFEPSQVTQQPTSATSTDFSRAADIFEEQLNDEKRDGLTPMVVESPDSEEITEGYNILPEDVQIIAREKLASLDALEAELKSQYDALESQRTNILGNYDEVAEDARTARRAYEISRNSGVSPDELQYLSDTINQSRALAQQARRERLAVDQYNRNPRRVIEMSRQGKDWRHSVSRAYIEPDEQDFVDVGGVPTDLGTINLSNTTTYQMTELASKIFSVQNQKKRLALPK